MEESAPPSQKPPVVPQANPTPVVEVTYPEAKAEDVGSRPAPPPSRPSRSGTTVFATTVTLMVCLLAGYACFATGATKGRSVRLAAAAAATVVTPLEVPAGASQIGACTVGRGAQYVLPQDAARGPIYNVYQGKVVGLEYIIGKADLNSNQSFRGLPLYNKRFDHLDIGGATSGKTGSAVTHYDIDLYNISHAAAAAITCK